MLYNRAYSSIMAEGLLGNVTFVGFRKSSVGLTGVDFVIWLTKPHWDNAQRIERAFRLLAELYYNQVNRLKTLSGVCSRVNIALRTWQHPLTRQKLVRGLVRHYGPTPNGFTPIQLTSNNFAPNSS